MAICWLCERSQEHHGHKTALVEEVDHEYKEKLQEALQKLMEKEKRCDEWQDAIQEQRTYLENEIQSDIKSVQIEINGLRELLDSKENEELQELKKEKEDVVKRLEESENELVQQRESVRDCISDIEHQLELSTMEMLQSVEYVLRRSQTLKLKLPNIILERRRKFQAPDLKGMLQTFEGLMDVQRYWVHVTPCQYNKEIVSINKNKGQIQCASHYRRNRQVSETFHLGVVGYPAIHSGKHYWEVDVSTCDAWLLGLSDGKCAQPHLMGEMGFKMKLNSNFNQIEMYQPKCGYWVIGMKDRSVYNAFDECSITHNPSVLVLSLPHPPSRVGVFVDREACTLSFYDVSNSGALIYRFYYPSFPRKVYPYFNPLECLKPMTVCGPPS